MKKKLLIGYNYILHYRIPLFNQLSVKYDVTVVHSGKKMASPNDSFKELIVPLYKFGPLRIQPRFLKEVYNSKYDIIIALFDVAWITTVISIFAHNKKAKFILWGAWITKSRLANYVRVLTAKKVDANIFYTQQARQDFLDRNLNPTKLFVANNTFDVDEQVHSYSNSIKNRILFVGSLDERKQNEVLIHAFKNIIFKIPYNISLTFVGEGTQDSLLKNLVKELELSSRVEFIGKIDKNKFLKVYYEQAIVSVSFGQSGLSVLQSFGYGVPFLTKSNSISGGEKSNIKHGFNGIFCDDKIESLEENLLKLCLNIPLARKLGKNAYNYYKEYCTMANMTQGFLDAIENTRLSKIDDKKYFNTI